MFSVCFTVISRVKPQKPFVVMYTPPNCNPVLLLLVMLDSALPVRHNISSVMFACEPLAVTVHTDFACRAGCPGNLQHPRVYLCLEILVHCNFCMCCSRYDFCLIGGRVGAAQCWLMPLHVRCQSPSG